MRKLVQQDGVQTLARPEACRFRQQDDRPGNAPGDGTGVVMGEPQFAFATFRSDLRHVFGRQRERAAPALQLHETKGADAEAHRKKRDAGEPQRGKPERNHARIKRETGVDGCGQRGGRSGVAERLQRDMLRRGGKL